MKDKFRDVSGRLTAYALACGYVEQIDFKGKRITLGRYGGGQRIESYYVELVYDGEIPDGKNNYYRQFQTLVQARKYWHELVNLF